MTVLVSERMLEQPFFTMALHDPVQIRLSIHAHGPEAMQADAHYLVVTGFFKLLHDLNVVSYRHSVTEEGLVFFVDVRETRHVVKNYLQNMKSYHALGAAWDLVIVDRGRVSTIAGDQRTAPLDAFGLSSLAYAHTQMGSRPLRFSRYFLYAALRPFARVRGYGSALMYKKDSREQIGFYEVLQGLELLQRSFQSVDLSGISSWQEIRAMERPLQDALNRLGRKDHFLRGILLSSMLLATVYEQKLPQVAWEERIRMLASGIEKVTATAFQPVMQADALAGFYALARVGFAPLLALLKEDRSLEDLDDLSLYLFSAFEDTTTLADIAKPQLHQVQKLARLAYEGKGVDRQQLDMLFEQNQLVSDGVRDMIVILRLLAFMAEEG